MLLSSHLDRCLPDWLGCGLRGQTSLRCLDSAIFLALHHFLPVLTGCHVIVRTDNMAVVSHINLQGGCVQGVMHPEQVCATFSCELKTGSFCPRRLEPRSRFPVNTETRPALLGIDVFAHPWLDLRLFAFPLVKIIPTVFCRVRECGICLLLVAPFWPSKAWFSELSSLVEESPWKILIKRDLLSQIQGRIWHPQPEIWRLWMWPIRGDC